MRARHPIAVGLLVSCTLGVFLPPGARAALRSPQVAISGSGLQTFLNSAGQTTDVRTGQDATQFLVSTVSANATFLTMFELLGGKPPGSSVGIYDAAIATPVPIELFPSESGPGWFAVATFRFAPVRVIVNVFDDFAELHSSTTYPGGNKSAIGIYMEGPSGRFYSQDHRNPSGDPQFLWFADTAGSIGEWWIAGEDAPLSGGADGDFDDTILYADPVDCVCPVQKCSWGAVKARFR